VVDVEHHGIAVAVIEGIERQDSGWDGSPGRDRAQPVQSFTAPRSRRYQCRGRPSLERKVNSRIPVRTTSGCDRVGHDVSRTLQQACVCTGCDAVSACAGAMPQGDVERAVAGGVERRPPLIDATTLSIDAKPSQKPCDSGHATGQPSAGRQRSGHSWRTAVFCLQCRSDRLAAPIQRGKRPAGRRWLAHRPAARASRACSS